MKTPANSNRGTSLVFSRSSLQRVVLSAAGLLFLMPSARSQGSEELYAIGEIGGPHLYTLDPTTGAITSSKQVLPIVTNLTIALTHDGARVVGSGLTNWFGDRMVRIHPADGTLTPSNLFGPPWNVYSMDRDPTTGQIHGICYDQWFGGLSTCSIDPQTGALTVHAPLNGVPNCTAVAIDSAGTIYATNTQGPKVCILDIQSGTATQVGQLLIAPGSFSDLAFNRAGELYGIFDDALSGSENGLYKIDLGSMTATRIVHIQHPYLGLTFGPTTRTSTYCVAKTSSNGCVPTIQASGVASPAAASGFTIRADAVPNNKAGLLFYSTSGRWAVPFQGGTLCVMPGLSRTVVVMSGGTPAPVQDCSGTWSLDYNAFIWDRFGGQRLGQSTTPVPAVLTPGTVVNCQWWGRDPGFPAPNNSSLSNAIEFTLAP